jgi:hypothetical protein
MVKRVQGHIIYNLCVSFGLGQSWFVISVTEETVWSVNILEFQTPIQNLSVSKIQNLLSKKTKHIIIDLYLREQTDYNCGRLFVFVQDSLTKFRYFITCKCNYVAVL